MFAVGLFFEAVGDEQLRRFKADPTPRAQVMDRGLWRYTRHPNYFGDFCVWWGLWLIALPAGGTWWTLVGPVVMSTLLIRVSGTALLERDMAKRRPGYADYIERTSGFFPLPPAREELDVRTVAAVPRERRERRAAQARRQQVVADQPAVAAAVAPDHLGGDQKQPPGGQQPARLALRAPAARSTASAASASASSRASHACSVRA